MIRYCLKELGLCLQLCLDKNKRGQQWPTAKFKNLYYIFMSQQKRLLSSCCSLRSSLIMIQMLGRLGKEMLSYLRMGPLLWLPGYPVNGKGRYCLEHVYTRYSWLRESPILRLLSSHFRALFRAVIKTEKLGKNDNLFRHYPS
ncbi:hypothetical protein CIPAW_05G151000 [Carya illinoinensis]|uniref:Uncharacterized protein n=1 Tax=Carya illinoinensis TaxID=32201 RepID=A0A8T1QJE2_CARIL|nr:hypothetical protein CIPAW_05G151000 [Carya illinoinensis]